MPARDQNPQARRACAAVPNIKRIAAEASPVAFTQQLLKLRLAAQPASGIEVCLALVQILLTRLELATQVGVALAKLQTLPQPPQFAASLVVLTSQPLFVLPSQFAKPPAQAIWQTPATQEAVPLGRARRVLDGW